MLLLIWKDVKNVVSDKRILMVILLMPIILMSILGFALKDAFGGNGSGIGSFTIGIVKEYNHDEEMQMFKDMAGQFNIDNTDTLPDPEQIFFGDFLDNPEINKMMPYKLVDKAEGEQLLNKGDIAALIILPKNYVYNTLMNFIMTRNKVDISILKNSDQQMSADIAEQVVKQFTGRLNTMINRRLALQPYLMNADADKLGKVPLQELLMPSNTPNFNLTVKEESGKDSFNSFQYYAIGMMAMFTLYAAGFGGRALIEEKSKFTLQRLKVAGKSLNQLVISNFIRVIVIAVLQSIIMIFYSSLVLGVNFGRPIDLVVPMLSSALAVASLGMLASVITLVSNSYAFSNVFEYGIVNLMALVGGSFIPVQTLPKVLQRIHLFSINGNSMSLYLNAAAGIPLSDSINYLVNLFIMDVLFAGSACLLLYINRRRIGELI